MNFIKGKITAVLASTLLCFSCVPQHEALGPEIKYVKLSSTYITMYQHDTVDFTVHAIAGDAPIELAPSVTYSLGTNDEEPASVKSSKRNDSGYAVTLNQILHDVGIYTFAISVADIDGLAAIDTVTVNVKILPAVLDTGTTISLGSGANTAGSYYSVDTKMVYTLDEAKTKVAKISFGYRYDAAAKASIFSATESTELKDSTGATETKFVVATGVTFATATDADLAKFVPKETILTGLAKNDVIAYKTAGGTTGFILVEALDGTTDGTATLVVKVK